MLASVSLEKQLADTGSGRVFVQVLLLELFTKLQFADSLGLFTADTDSSESMFLESRRCGTGAPVILLHDKTKAIQ